MLPKERSVTKALRETRQGLDPVGGEQGEFFGQNVVHVFEPGMVVRLKDKVEIVQRADERNWFTAA